MADESTLLRGRQLTTGKECLPCAITAGEMLTVTKSKGFDPQRAAFFMPGSSGPCRFGMYSCLHKLILKYVGMPDVPVISPNQDSNFYSEFSECIDGSKMRRLMKDMWVSVVGMDLLRKLLLRLRPFAADPSHAQQVYEKSISRYIRAVENRSRLSQMRRLMSSIAEEFEKVQFDNEVKKPLVGIVGEIYVRSHEFANLNIIDRLEKLGAVCDLASLAEWIYYTNWTRGKKAKRRGQFRNLLTNVAQNLLQHKIETMLAKPLEEKFGKLAESPVGHVIELARPYMHHSFEGEAILSVGKTVEYYKEGVGGVVNVMPFSCMPSTVVSGLSMQVSADCGDMPILNLSFDGQEDSALTTRLEAFIEQVASRQDASLTVSQLIRV